MQCGYTTVSLPVKVYLHHSMHSHPPTPVCTLLTCTCSSQSPECSTHTGYRCVAQSFLVRDHSQSRSWAEREAAGMRVTWGQGTLQVIGLRLLAACVWVATSIHHTTETTQSAVQIAATYKVGPGRHSSVVAQVHYTNCGRQ